VIKVLKDVIPFGWQAKPSMLQTLKQFPVTFEDETLPNKVVQETAIPVHELKTGNYVDTVVKRDVVESSAIELASKLSEVSEVKRSVQNAMPVKSTIPAASPSVQREPIAVVEHNIAQDQAPVPLLDVGRQNMVQSGQPTLVEQEPPIVQQQEPVVQQRRSGRLTQGVAPTKLTYGELGNSAFVADPVTVLRENFVMPRMLGNSATVVEVKQEPVQRQRTFKPVQGKTRRSIVPDVWSDPNRVAGMLANASVVVADMEIPVPVSVVSGVREQNSFDLPQDVLDRVAFLAEVPEKSKPEGLHMPLREQHEVSYNYACKHPQLFPQDQLEASLVKEMKKMTTGMGVLEEVTDPQKQIEANALFVPSMVLCKQKYHSDGSKDVISSRFAMIGSQTDASTFGDTSAATADEATMLCCMSAFQAHAITEGYVQQLGYESFDVCGAFLHIDLVSPVMIITRIPSQLAHPLAGKVVIVRKSCYGLRQSNKAFADDFNKTIQSQRGRY
jgi:hypothetical protein